MKRKYSITAWVAGQNHDLWTQHYPTKDSALQAFDILKGNHAHPDQQLPEHHYSSLVELSYTDYDEDGFDEDFDTLDAFYSASKPEDI